MFGHKDEDEQKEDVVMPAAEPLEGSDNDVSVGTGPVASGSSDDTPSSDSSAEADNTSAPSLPTPSPSSDNDSDSTASLSPDPEPAKEDEPRLTPPTASNTSPDDLLNLKKDALEELVPLVGHLDQTPEERFKTTMMMIQATDASDLISTAYEAAKEISDEKARAQALLDVVNEINYFTQAANAPK